MWNLWCHYPWWLHWSCSSLPHGGYSPQLLTWHVNSPPGKKSCGHFTYFWDSECRWHCFLTNGEVSRAVSDMEDADLMPPSGHRSCGLNILKQRRAPCSCRLGIIEMDLFSSPWPEAALLWKLVMFTARTESLSVPVAVNAFWAE